MQRKLLSLAPELRAQVTDTTIKRQVPREATQALLKETDQPTEDITEDAQVAHMPAAFAVAARATRTNSGTPGAHLNTITDMQDADMPGVATHYLVSPGNTRNWSEDRVLGQLEYSPLIERIE